MLGAYEGLVQLDTDGSKGRILGSADCASVSHVGV